MPCGIAAPMPGLNPPCNGCEIYSRGSQTAPSSRPIACLVSKHASGQNGGLGEVFEGWYRGGTEAGRTFLFAFISSSVERAPLLSDQFFLALPARFVRDQACPCIPAPTRPAASMFCFGGSWFFPLFLTREQLSRFLNIESEFYSVHIVPFFVLFSVVCASTTLKIQIQT